MPVIGRDVTQRCWPVAPGVAPRWTITSAGALQRSFDQGHTWQTVDVNANPASSGGATNVEAVAKTSPSKLKDSGRAFKREAQLPSSARSPRLARKSGRVVPVAPSIIHWTPATTGPAIIPASDGATLTGDMISLEFPDMQHGKVCDFYRGSLDHHRRRPNLAETIASAASRPHPFSYFGQAQLSSPLIALPK